MSEHVRRDSMPVADGPRVVVARFATAAALTNRSEGVVCRFQ